MHWCDQFNNSLSKMGAAVDDLSKEMSKRGVDGAYESYTGDELAIVAEVLAIDLRDSRNLVADLKRRLEQRGLDDAEVARTRLSLHATGSALLYVTMTAMMDGSLLNHPHAAAFILALNLFVWSLVSAGIRFG